MGAAVQRAETAPLTEDQQGMFAGAGRKRPGAFRQSLSIGGNPDELNSS